MSEQIVELTKDSVAAEPSITANGALSMQAGIGFTLVGTNLYALFQRKDGANTFLVMPTDHEPSGGMTIAEMVDEINNLLNGAAPGSGTLKTSRPPLRMWRMPVKRKAAMSSCQRSTGNPSRSVSNRHSSI